MRNASDDISNDVNTLGTCFSMFAYILARFRFTLIGESTGSHIRIGGGIQIPETQLQARLPFPVPPPERPVVACSQAIFVLRQKKIPNDQKVRLSPRIKLLPWDQFLNHNSTTFDHRCYTEHKMLSPRNGCTLAGREP